MKVEAVLPVPVCIAWRRIDVPGHDAAVLSRHHDGWQLEGAAAFVELEIPCHFSYRLSVDASWRTRSIDVRGWYGSRRVDRTVIVGEGEWYVDGKHVPAVTGCIDADLAFTPATNLLPIRRLHLDIDHSAQVVAAWLTFPEFELQPLEQVYRRSADTTYDYASNGGAFRATIEVSSEGFVTNYSGLWREERG